MEVRRRAVDSVGAAAGDESAATLAAGNLDTQSTRLVEEGLRLYAQVEKNGFRNSADLVHALRCFLRAAAARDGNREEATEWISSFLDSTSALPPSVVADLPASLLRLLRWVGGATPEEREVYLVAADMFREMVGRGDSSISRRGMDGAVTHLLSSGQYEDSPQLMKSARGVRMAVKRMLCSALESNKSEEVTEDMFCVAAVEYARGVLPHDSGALSPKEQQEFNDANILKKVTKYPAETAHFYKRAMLKLIERCGIKWIWSSFPTKQFYLLSLAYFLPMISPNFILTSLATVAFLAGFISMCVGTLQIILAAEKVASFMEYSSLFRYFSKGDRKLNSGRPRAVLIGRSILPCVTFGASFCATLLTFYLSHRSMVPNEVVCIISGFCTLVVFLQFEGYKSPLFLSCSSTRLLPWLHASLVVFREALPIPDFLLHLGSASVHIPLLFSGLTLPVNLFTLIQFPVQCTLIAYFLVRNGWSNIYSGLGPYLLFTSWWVLTRHFFLFSSPLYLFLGTFGFIFFLAVSPFIPLMIVASPVLVLFYYGLSRVFYTYIALVVSFVVILLLLGRFSRRLMEAKWLNISFDWLVLLQILITIPAVLMGASLVVRHYTPTDVPPVTLAQYGEYCGPQNWAGGGNMVETQLNCLHLKDQVLVTSGLVEGVKIEQVSSSYELGLQSLPGIIGGALTCLLGSRQEPMCGSREDMETCKREFTGCHFHDSYKFTFAVDVKLTLPSPHGQQVKISTKLLTSNSYKEAVRDLRVGQTIRFNSTFVSGMGSDRLVLQLVDLEGFTSSRDREIENEEDSLQLLAYRVVESLANTLKVLLDVLLGYTALLP